MEKVCLDNGITVIFEKLEGFNIAACTISFGEGTATESKRGETVLSLRVGAKRSRLKEPLTFYRNLEKISSSFSGEVSFDYSFLKFQSIGSHLEETFNLLLEVLENPDFSKENFEVEREYLLALIRSRKENPFLLAYEKLNALTYEGTPYEYPLRGTESSVREITPEEGERRFREVVFCDKIAVALSGELKGIEKIIKRLEKVETHRRKEVKVEKEIEEDKTLFVEREGSAQSFIMIALNAPSVKEADYEKFKLLNTLLGEGIMSVLFQELREKEGLAYSTGSFYPATVGKGRIYLYIGTSPSKEEKAVQSLQKVVKNLPDFVTEERLERAKEYLKGTFLLDMETRGRRSWVYSFWELAKGDPNYNEQLSDKISRISLKELTETAEKLSASPIHTVVVKDG